MGNKLHLSQQNAPVSPNAEDLSLILGSMARGRSFSTTINPKMGELITPSSSLPQSSVSHNAQAWASSSAGSSADSSGVVRRKKSMPPQLQRDKDTSTAEEFFIEVIIQRHARRLLQDKKLEALGYMSAALDFHLVGWLAREKDRAARIEDFIAALKQLHEDFDWPKPSLDLKLNRRPSDKSTQQQQESPSYSLQSLRVDTHMGTGDSGYTSLPPPHLEFGLSNEQNHYVNSNMSSSDSNQNTDLPYIFHPELSNVALQNIQLSRFNELCRITEEDEARSSHQVKNITKTPSNYDSLRREPSLLGDVEANLLPLDNASVISEQVSQWGEDVSGIFNPEVDYDRTIETLATQSSRTVCRKLEVKTRYLLQLFTEACCFDFALILSIILLDAASISRITNAAIRSGSLSACRQLRNGLKDVTRWSFQEWYELRSWSVGIFCNNFSLHFSQSRLSSIHDGVAAASTSARQICHSTGSDTKPHPANRCKTETDESRHP